ncbi:MAG: Sodium/hydrogen exchanger family-domain-containing protein [Benniella sp.]|nr:MAG: Sodium/hydrogen exchanger family-domain-containing protein [Benniella sp.]
MAGSAIVFESTPEHVAYALLGCFIMVFGLVSLFVKEKLFISEAFVSTVFGIIIGPYVIGIFDPAGWKDFDLVTLEFTRIVIAIQVMAAGVSLPRSYVVKERLSLFMIIVPLMVLMWLTSALLIWVLIPNLDFVQAMLIGACIAPTDPVLSNSVVKGRFAEKHVPPRIRYILSAESGINDGMGLPFLFLALYLLREPSTGTAIAKWFYLVWAYQILLSIIIGGVIGAAARKLVKGAKNRKLIDKESFLAFSIALALAVTGIVSILASDDLLACFVAGNVFAWDDWFSNEIAEAHIQEIIDMLLNLACFIYIGASIPFSSFANAALGFSVWRMVVLALAVLFLRRLPFMVILKPLIPALTTYREAAFAGWFGPIGVGAVFFSKVIAMLTSPHHLGENPYNLERLNRVREVVFSIVMFLVFSSVLIHGITVPLLHLQYKYTRTWSRKREDNDHAVTRLPRINIGDDIPIRPPTVNGSTAVEAEGGYDPQRSIGYDNQRSIGYDNQRSIGYDHQRSVNQRSYGYGGTAPYGGFGIAGVPDLGRTSTSNNNTVRTLQDVVKEMKDAKRGPTSPPQSPAPRDSLSISFNLPFRDRNGSQATTAPNSPGGISPTDNGKDVAQSLRENHPATHLTIPHASDIRSDSPESAGSGSSGNSPRQSRLPATLVKIHEVEQEQDNGVVRTASHDMDEKDRARIERELSEDRGSHSSNTASDAGRHLTDLFKQA